MKDQQVMNCTAENRSLEHQNNDLVVLCGRLVNAVAELTRRLQAHYEGLHPGRSEVVRSAIAAAEATAWELSSFPHLFLPDLVEARMAELALQPTFARTKTVLAHAA
jgi:hypothetical protein